ncbi:MAG: SMI1/KNR4 family protein [Tildeniella nuda ZEHNDER 1965/U140]|jgi:hypothetical protein|nr:SMI1/KNR4 family protein [Tildeniella nuda ZEHNDER 1965/U140]
MSPDAFRVPTDAEIDHAEQMLEVPFHPDYRAFLKSGSTVVNAGFEPAIVLPDSGHLYLVEMAKTQGYFILNRDRSVLRPNPASLWA